MIPRRKHQTGVQYLSDADLCHMHVYAMAHKDDVFMREAARAYWREIERRGYSRG